MQAAGTGRSKEWCGMADERHIIACIVLVILVFVMLTGGNDRY